MFSRERTTILVALGVYALVAIVYMITLAPTVPFWDAGEFIACSYILGIPHPPGTPLYILLGRVWSLVPWGTVAQRINAMSALPSALTIVLTYLTTLKLIRLAQTPAVVEGEEPPRSSEWIAHLGAVVGALLLAFSDNFWENSIEAEVYSLASLAQILVFWLGLKWWEEHEKRPTAGPLLVAVYVMWLSVGLHLGVGLMGLPLIVLVWLVDRRSATVFAMPCLAIMLVTQGLEKMAGGVIVLSMITFVVLAFQRKLNEIVVMIAGALAIYALYFAYGDKEFTPLAAAVAVVSVGLPLVALSIRSKEGRILALALGLMVIGYSTHAYLPIRAALHPAINEGNPSTWPAFRDLLERKQYGQMDMFTRRASWDIQINKEFWRYFSRQWLLFPAERLWPAVLPLFLGLAGAWWQFRREKKSFLYTFVFFGLSTAGLIVFLNFSDHEVRDRDYFFTTGYHVYAMWMGMGVSWALLWIRESFSPGGLQRIATAAAAVLLASQPVLLARTMWHSHDRRGNYVAHDYAYNMLAGLKPNSYMFTNGDNDTFPLWYMQQVEHFRQDVRVVNLSLLNTDWYIQQLRDEAPKVPMQLDDATIRQLGQGYVRDADGRVLYTNEFMVHHLIDESRKGDGWSMQPYFAVTVPEHYGYDKYFTLEGLAYRVNRDSLQGIIDVPATTKALYDTFKYRGLFFADGAWDTLVFKDENASTLSRNYMAAHIQLAYHYRGQGNLKNAIAEMERVSRMFPDFTEGLVPLGSFYMESGDTAKAIDLFRRLTASNPGNSEAWYYYGLTLGSQGRLDAALACFDKAILLDANYPQPFYAAYSALGQAGQTEKALGYLEQWLATHPQDAQTRNLLDSQRPSANATRPLPARPVAPVLP